MLMRLHPSFWSNFLLGEAHRLAGSSKGLADIHKKLSWHFCRDSFPHVMMSSGYSGGGLTAFARLPAYSIVRSRSRLTAGRLRRCSGINLFTFIHIPLGWRRVLFPCHPTSRYRLVKWQGEMVIPFGIRRFGSHPWRL